MPATKSPTSVAPPREPVAAAVSSPAATPPPSPRKPWRHRTVEEVRDALEIAQGPLGYSTRKLAEESGVSSRSIIHRITGYYGTPSAPRDVAQLDLLREFLDAIGAFAELDRARYGEPAPVVPDPVAFRARPLHEEPSDAELRHIRAVLGHAREEGYEEGVRDAYAHLRAAFDAAMTDEAGPHHRD